MYVGQQMMNSERPMKTTIGNDGHGKRETTNMRPSAVGSRRTEKMIKVAGLGGEGTGFIEETKRFGRPATCIKKK